MPPRVAQKLAFQRTVDGLLALLTAALRANVAVQRRTSPPRRPHFTQMAGDAIHRDYRTIQVMTAFDMYLKVEVDLDEGENPKKFAEELCRILSRVYGVRRTEITSLHDVSDQ